MLKKKLRTRKRNGRIIAIDYGLKRVGLAVSDPNQIIAQGLIALETEELLPFIQKYIKDNDVVEIVLGLPKNLQNNPTHSTQATLNFHKKLQITFPELSIALQDERFTSKIAVQTMVLGGKKKKYRSYKGNIDRISATIILQLFLETKNNRNTF